MHRLMASAYAHGMRVLLTIPSFSREFGGPSSRVFPMAEALRERGHDVRVVGCGNSGGRLGAVELPVLFQFHATPMPRSLGSLPRLVRGSDVVHSIGFRDLSTFAGLIAGRAGIPFVLEPVGMHGYRGRSGRLKGLFDRSLGRRLVDSAAAVIAASRLEAEELAAGGVSSERIHIRPNAIDVADLLPLPTRGAFRRRAGIPEDVPLVLALGRIVEGKGLRQLVRVLEQLDGAFVAIVGPDSGDGTLEELVAAKRDMAHSERLVLQPGGLWGRDKASAFADADAFCLFSRSESFGNAAAEAAAVGLPVVVSAECGVADLLTEIAPDSTVVAPYGDRSALAEALGAVRQPGKRAAALERATDVLSALSWPALMERQLDIYKGAQA